MRFFGLLLFAYLLGSVPWGLILVKLFTANDIRHQGSGNIGATNVRRLAGNRLGAATLFLDMAKGALPVYLASGMVGAPTTPLAAVFLAIVALSAVAGHLYPVFLKGSAGGKGAATALGCFVILSPPAAAIAVLVFVMMVCFSGRVSVGSMTAAITMPIAVWESTRSAAITGCALLLGFLIVWRHKDNIVRLKNGTEPRIFDR